MTQFGKEEELPMVECSGAVCACGINCCEQCRMRAESILNATRGYSPECVAACIEAVKAGIDSDRHLERCEENQCKHCGHMAAHARKMYFDAIGLLPKE